MVTIEKEDGITVLRRTMEYGPPRSWRTWLIGRPLPTADAPHQAIGKAIGLAVFAADALSSVAYAPQETLVILAAAGVAGFAYAFPIAVAATVLLTIVTISYQQTVQAYPGDGGAYIVARDNLGEVAAQTAGAALLTDYILLAAVATSSGVAQIVSAYPFLFPYRVPLAVGLIMLIMLANLRGVKGFLRLSLRPWHPLWFKKLVRITQLLPGHTIGGPQLGRRQGCCLHRQRERRPPGRTECGRLGWQLARERKIARNL